MSEDQWNIVEYRLGQLEQHWHDWEEKQDARWTKLERKILQDDSRHVETLLRIDRLEQTVKLMKKVLWALFTAGLGGGGAAVLL